MPDIEKKYDHEYGNLRRCVCGHSYISHFSNEEPHVFVGCSHCICGKFIDENDETLTKVIDA